MRKGVRGERSFKIRTGLKEILDTMFPNSSEQESYIFIDIGSGCGNLCATIEIDEIELV